MKTLNSLSADNEPSISSDLKDKVHAPLNIKTDNPVIILLTVNENETQALLDEFLGEGKTPSFNTIDGVTYNELGIHGGHRIVHTVCEMGAGGIGASQHRTRQAIENWQPHAIIAVGIAFGLDEKKQCIGDVLISTQLQDYELSRLNEDGTLTPRGNKPGSSDILCNRLRQANTTQRRLFNDWPKVHFGLMLSGQKLVDNLDYRDSLKFLFTEAIGGEMEGSGLYVSASEARVDWIVVKAICDWGHNKNQADKDSWQQLAAKNAARVLKASLDIGCLYSNKFDKIRKIHAEPSSYKANIYHSPNTDLSSLNVEQYKPPLVDISRIDKYAPEELVGRDDELALLDDAWSKTQCSEPKRPHVLTFVALGGEGKTSLVAKWVAELAYRAWPGCEAAFAWTFYSRGASDQNMASSDTFFKEALTFFGDTEMAQSAQGAYEKGRQLARLVGERRALLILDGLEPLQYSPTSPMPGELKDSGIAALLKGLAAQSCGFCIVTTRYSLPDLRTYRQTTSPERELKSLSREAGVHLLQKLGVKGSNTRNIPFNDGEMVTEFEKLVEDVKGHALTLNLIGSYLLEFHNGDIRKRDLIKLDEANEEEQDGHAFRVMDAYVRSFENSGKTVDGKEKGRLALAILRLLGLFDRPATADCLDALWKNKFISGLTDPFRRISDAQRNRALIRLEEIKLINVNRDTAGGLVSIDTHPLVREYFARKLRENNPDALCIMHKRLYNHLCLSTQEGDRPTLEALQPLYQAVAHGCQAGLHQDAFEKVYRRRISRGREFYSTHKLCAYGSDLGALACFFEIPWNRISPVLTEDAQANILNDTAFDLRALGRLVEAIELFQKASEWAVSKEDWQHAVEGTGNLSELELTLGNIAKAVADSENALCYADRSGDEFQRTCIRAIYADNLNQKGKGTEAATLFTEAEKIQAESQSRYPLLYSLPGFRYCDLLLAEVEREAGKIEGKVIKEEMLVVCKAVSERAAQTLELIKNTNWLLDIALDNLTIGRATLYHTIIDRENFQFLSDNEGLLHIDRAVAGLRRAVHQDHLPRGLLTRAWLRALTGLHTGPESAQTDLDEAWEIAERGPMPLFMADIHLYRARLFFHEAEYPWESPQSDLAEARRLIEKHGYWRRKEELEDAEAAVEKWLKDHR